MSIPKSVKQLKDQLGLNIPNTSKGTHPSEVNELLKGFAAINKKYSDHKPAQARRSKAIKDEASKLFIRLGQTLWPDIDERAETPSWLTAPSSDSNKQYWGRRYYSSSTDREFLAERFHALICEKVGQYHRNGKREPKTHPPSDLEQTTNVKESGSIDYDDVSVYQHIAGHEQDNLSHHSTPGTPEVQREDNTPRSTGHQQMSPNTTPAASVSQDQDVMGQIQSAQDRQAEVERGFRDAGVHQYTEQQKKSNDTLCDQLDNSSTVFEMDSPQTNRRSSSAYEPSQSPPRHHGQKEPPLSHITQSTKRPLADGTRSRSRTNKKNKMSSSVHTALGLQPSEATLPLSNIGSSYKSSPEPVTQADNILAQPTMGRREPADAIGSRGQSSEAAKEALHPAQPFRETRPSPTTSYDTVLKDTTATRITSNTDQIPSFDYRQLVEDIIIKVYIDRNDGLEPRGFGAIAITGLRSGNDFFRALQYELGWRLAANEKFSKAIITEAGDPVTERPKTDLWLCNANQLERSWFLWLEALREFYEKTGVDLQMRLKARVLVTRKDDAK